MRSHSGWWAAGASSEVTGRNLSVGGRAAELELHELHHLARVCGLLSLMWSSDQAELPPRLALATCLLCNLEAACVVAGCVAMMWLLFNLPEESNDAHAGALFGDWVYG